MSNHSNTQHTHIVATNKLPIHTTLPVAQHHPGPWGEDTQVKIWHTGRDERQAKVMYHRHKTRQ